MDILKIKNFFGNTLNVGSNNEYTINDIAKKILEKLNSKANIKKEPQRTRSPNSEVVRLVCDNSKILKNGFQIVIIPQTLKLTNLLYIKKRDVVNVEFDVLGKYIKSFLK